MNRKQEPVLELIKLHNLILSFLDRADENWEKSLPFLIKAQRGLQRLSQERFTGILRLDPLYRYFQRLLLEAQSGNHESMQELRTYITELRDTWVKARKRYLSRK